MRAIVSPLQRARRHIAAACLLVAVAGVSADSHEARLDALVADYVRGEREADSLPPATAAAFRARLEARRAMLAALRKVDDSGLSADARIDRRLLTGILEADVYGAEQRRPWEIEPRPYLPPGRLGQAMASWEFGELDEQALITLLNQIPPRLDAARENLQRPPRRFTEAALYEARQTREALAAAAADQLQRANERKIKFGRMLHESAQSEGLRCKMITSEPNNSYPA